MLILAQVTFGQTAAEPPAPGDELVSPPKAQVIEEEGVTAAPDDDTVTPVPDVPEVDKPEDEASVVAPIENEDTVVEPDLEKPVNEGIQIEVEKFSSNLDSTNETGQVKVYSPWPAKPLDAPPLGWKFVPAPEGIEPYRTTVKLGAKSSVDLAITPYVLVPASDGKNVIRIAEPGYQPELKAMQENTIGSILQKSTKEIERHEQKAGQAIQRLQELLTSLPQP